MRAAAIVGAACVVAAAAFAAMPAAAQQAPAAAVDTLAPPGSPDEAVNPQPETPLTPEEETALANALTFDATTLTGKPAKPLRLPTLDGADKIDVSTGKPGGSSTMTMNRALANDWDAKVGADLKLAPAPDGTYRPDKPLPMIGGDQDAGTAWASVGMPNLATVDARVDSGNDQGKVGTTLKRSIPVGSGFLVTLQNSYSVTQSVGAPPTTPSTVPLMAAPAGTAAAPAPQVWGTQKVIKFDVLSTGTTFGAGVTTTSNDPITHNTFNADQKLYGPLHVTTAVTDLGQPTASKSIAAALKLHW